MQELVQYVRKDIKNRRTKVGMFLAKRDENGVPRIYWSKVNLKEGDEFDREEGRKIALNRPTSVVHNKFKKHYNRFKERCERYFKEEVS